MILLRVTAFILQGEFYMKTILLPRFYVTSLVTLCAISATASICKVCMTLVLFNRDVYVTESNSRCTGVVGELV